MKPIFSGGGRERGASGEASRDGSRFPQTDCFFQAGFDRWRGHSFGDDNADAHSFHHLTRQWQAVHAREYGREMVVFGLMVLASAWLVIYMVVTVVSLLNSGQH